LRRPRFPLLPWRAERSEALETNGTWPNLARGPNLAEILTTILRRNTPLPEVACEKTLPASIRHKSRILSRLTCISSLVLFTARIYITALEVRALTQELVNSVCTTSCFLPFPPSPLRCCLNVSERRSRAGSTGFCLI
jgi:hypothetical protein